MGVKRMTKAEAITELVRIWHSPHLDLSLKAGLAEVIDTLKEKNRSDSLVTDSSDACKESESKLGLISRQDAIKNAHFPMIDDAGYEVVRVDDILALPSAEPKTGEWILSNHLWQCNQCGCRVNRKNPLKGNIWNYNFCPNCGAKMGGGAE